MRVLSYMVICASFYLDFRLFKVRSLRSRGGEIPEFASRFLACLDYQTFLRPLVATSDNRCIPIVCPVLGDISPSISRLEPKLE